MTLTHRSIAVFLYYIRCICHTVSVVICGALLILALLSDFQYGVPVTSEPVNALLGIADCGSHCLTPSGNLVTVDNYYAHIILSFHL